MDVERLFYSDGSWHRNQRKKVPFETSCYYTHEPSLTNGCQYSVSKTGEWLNDAYRREQRSLLIDFYRLLGGPNWRTSDNWSEGDPCWDGWYGVTCDEHGHVIALVLTDNLLYGSIPSNFAKLKSLMKLDLSTTADSYHNHANEVFNYVMGEMPSLAEMTRLEEIEVSGNRITALPVDLYLNAQTLRSLSASRNLLTQLPQYLNRYIKLHTLELDHNQIAGTIPTTIGQMESARYIQLENNELSGTIPVTVSLLGRIRCFDVSHNVQLSGEIPIDIIIQWAQAEYLAILNTTITGYIASLCIDVPLCFKYMYDMHKDLTWATASDIPDVVNMTMELAVQGAAAAANSR